MSVAQQSPDQSQSPASSSNASFFSTSTSPITRKNSSPPVVPVLVNSVPRCEKESTEKAPQPLRKAFSVDSFSPYGPHRGQSVPQPERVPVATSATKIHPAHAGRLRGESLSDRHQRPVFVVDADGDRYDPLSASATERYRRGLKSTAKQPVRGGDLPLPSRSSANAISPIASASSALPTAPANTSQNPSRQIPVPSGRSRSGSIGLNPPVSSRKITINTQVPPAIPSNQDIVLLVLGTHGCGKSTIIRKGLADANLGETSVIWENPRYICRLAYVGLGGVDSQGSYSHVLKVVEGDIASTATSLPHWPPELPPIDGILLCYDSTSQESFRPIKGLLKGCRELGLPVVVLHCKAEKVNEDGSGVNPQEALADFKNYDTGLIQVSSVDSSIKYKMGRSIDYVLKAAVRQRGANRVEDNRNPASPTILTSSPVISRAVLNTSPRPSDTLPLFSSAPNADQDIPDRLVSDLNIQVADVPPIPEEHTLQANPPTVLPEVVPEVPNTQTNDLSDGDESDTEEESTENQKGPVSLPATNGVITRGIKHGQWTHLDDLLDRLLFIAISEDDPTFIANFLLTYRRFATPRSVLLAMHKRIRQLDNPSGDPMFACFAQMRVCHLLETWVRDYPNDFAAKGTFGALNSLVKNSILTKTHLLHYGSEFVPFLEQVLALEEEDAAWALKGDMEDAESEMYYESEDDETNKDVEGADAASVRALSSCSVPSRERKSSIPLTKTFSASQTEPTPKQMLKDLVKLSNELLTYDSDDVAKEITRHGVQLFLKIKPRDWVHFTFASGKKGKHDPIGDYNSMSNYLANWVSCLILCHDQPRQRARQVEKFVEIALKIRQLNNYSGLRAFVAGINLAADDVTLEAFKMKSPEAAKHFMSWDVLLKQLRSHRAYRLALRNSKGGCIPALEVHMQDLIKANEANANQREDDPSLIHWGKYNMIGRFIGTVAQCQTQCRSSPSYSWTERRDIYNVLWHRQLMTLEMQEARLNIPELLGDNPASSSSNRDTSGLRKLIFW